MTDEARRPLLRVVRGDPTSEELAALVAVISARPVGSANDRQRAPSMYADPSSAHRKPVHIGAGVWVASGWVPGTRTRAAW
jgi:hypothetical protein